jgi:hypothetical protein
MDTTFSLPRTLFVPWTPHFRLVQRLGKQAFVEVEAPEEEWIGWVSWEQVAEGGAGPA